MVDKKFQDAQQMVDQIEILSLIIKDGVSCCETGGSESIWFKDKWNSVYEKVQEAAKEQARKDLERIKKELETFLQSV